MKKLQNNFTTPKQSKRLLELGVPADSADMILIREKSGDMQFYDEQYEKQALNWGEKYSDWDTLEWHMTHHILPCWSVGQLIKIYITCIEHYTGDERLIFGRDTVRLGMIDCIIAAIEVGCDDGDMDFSKLEE